MYGNAAVQRRGTQAEYGPTSSLLEAARGSGWLQRVITVQKNPSVPAGTRATPLVPLGPLRSASAQPPAEFPGTLTLPVRSASTEPPRLPAPAVPAPLQGGARHAAALQAPGPQRRPAPRTPTDPQQPQPSFGAPLGGGGARPPESTAAESAARSRPAPSAAAESAVPVRSPDDQFSGDERSIIRLINACRTAPGPFADDIEREYVLGPPEVSPPQNVRRARRTLSELTRRIADSQRRLVDMRMRHAQEIADVLRAEEEAAQAAAAKAKKPPPKKRGKSVCPVTPAQAPAAEPPPISIEERKEGHRAVEEAAQRALADLSAQAAACAGGVARVDAALACIRALPGPLRPLRYSRGLSLSARDHAAAIGERAGGAAEGADQWRALLRRYGMPVGGSGVAVLLGSRSAMSAAFDALCDSRWRPLLLSPEFAAAGCGWQRHRQERTVAVIALAEAFADCRHVRSRPHCTLAEVRHQFEQSVDPFVFPILFLGGSGVEPVEPTEHPMEAGPVAEVLLRCPDDAEVAACLEEEPHAAPPSRPRGVSTLVQWEAPRRVRVRAALPAPGTHALAVFARPAGALGFARIGSIEIHSSGWPTGHRAQQFAEATAAFGERRFALVEPLCSPLPSGVPVNFAVSCLPPPRPARREAPLQQQLEAKDNELRQAEQRYEEAAAELRALQAVSAASAAPMEASVRASRSGRRGSSASRQGSVGADELAMSRRPSKRPPHPSPTAVAEAQRRAARLAAEVEVRRRQMTHLRTQRRVLALGAGDKSSAEPPSPRHPLASGRDGEIAVVSGGVRKVLSGPEPHGQNASLWRRDGVELQPGTAVLLAGGQCIARWHVR